MKAAIVSGGVVDDYKLFAREIKKHDIIICADGGIYHLINVNIRPHIFIGDFDSSSKDDVAAFIENSDTKIITHIPEKDDTDTQLCINYAIENGFSEITLFACLGGRVDHQLSNILNLKYILDNGAKGVLFSENNIIYVTDNCIEIAKKPGYKLSVIPLTPVAEGVTIQGTKYPLNEHKMIQGTSLGISNEFDSEIAKIMVKSGVLLVIVSKDE